jgi:hypothetical protein
MECSLVKPKRLALRFWSRATKVSNISRMLQRVNLESQVLAAASNALEDLLPLVADALLAIGRIQPGQIILVTA